MASVLTKPIRNVIGCMVFCALIAPVSGFAQEQGGAQQPNSEAAPTWRRFSTQANQEQPAQAVPSRLTLKPGAFISVRVDQFLSSNKNHAGDGFSATLTKPLVVDGIVVARRGEIVGGRVAEVQKAGRVKGVSRLGVRLTDLTLADGQQVPIQTQLTGYEGSTSKGRDAAAVATTTTAGTMIGAAADWGTGAAIGAGAGALAGVVGVLLTRGRATEIYPESVLTFRLAAPVTISTDRAPQAFSYVGNESYERTAAENPPRLTNRACEGNGCPPPPPYLYPPLGYPYPYYWGPSFTFWYGSGFHRGWGHRHWR